MGIIIRQSFWNSIWSYIGIALGYVNVVLLFPRFLEPDEFGLTRVFIAASMITAQLGSLGIINISIKYFPFFKSNSDNKHSGFLFFGFLLSTIGSLLCVIGLIVFKPLIVGAYIERSELFVEYYYWLIPLSIALIYFNQLSSYARVILKSSLQTFARDLLIRFLQFCCILGYALHWYDFETFVSFFILSYFVNGAFVVLYLVFSRAVHLLPDWQFYRKLPLGEIGKYGAFVLFSGVGGYIAGNIDILMIGSLATDGLADVAIYSVAFYIGNIVNVPIKSVYSIAIPIIAEAWKNNDMAKIEELYKKSSINQLIIGCLLLIGLWANIDNMFMILPEEYVDGKIVVLIIALSQLFNIAAGVNGGIIVNSPYYKYDSLFIGAMVVLNIALNIIFIKMLGFIGAAVATAITIIFFNVGRVITVQIKSKMHPFSKKTIYILLLSLAVYGLQMLMPTLDIMLLDLAIR
ncbi:MAG: hypothetical protein WD334_05300, partial [Chitinophagales bacterium]